MSNVNLIQPGRYLVVSALTGTVMNVMNIIRGSKAEDAVKFEVPENYLLIGDPGVSMARGRKVADIREISLEDKRKVADAVAAAADRNSAPAKPEKKESRPSAPAVDLLSSGEGEAKE